MSPISPWLSVYMLVTRRECILAAVLGDVLGKIEQIPSRLQPRATLLSSNFAVPYRKLKIAVDTLYCLYDYCAAKRC